MENKKQFNLNNHVVLYPKAKGWEKILDDIEKTYNLTDEEAVKWVKKRTTAENGYKEQLWVIIDIHHDMFFNGNQYIENTNIDLIYKEL